MTRAGAGLAAEERLGHDPTSELWGEHRSRYRFACDHVSGRRVLDIACGVGFGLAMLHQAGARVVGMDLDAAALAAAAQAVPGPARLARSDAARLPLRDASMDVVVSFETLEHVPDAAAAVSEFRRILRPSGLLVLSTPNRAYGPPERHQNNPFHVREFTAEELRDLLGESFGTVVLYGQLPAPGYRYVPYLMTAPTWQPSAVAWKLMRRLPFAARDALARGLTGRPFYPGEADYQFVAGRTAASHDLVAVASGFSSDSDSDSDPEAVRL